MVRTAIRLLELGGEGRPRGVRRDRTASRAARARGKRRHLGRLGRNTRSESRTALEHPPSRSTVAPLIGGQR